jgi:hypothetical protein
LVALTNKAKLKLLFATSLVVIVLVIISDRFSITDHPLTAQIKQSVASMKAQMLLNSQSSSVSQQ